MSARLDELHTFLASKQVALVEVADAKGSTPREEGAWMLVSHQATLGTIGGGQLEYMTIDKARQMLGAGDRKSDVLSVPLGPEIGQCCGGRVEILVRRVDEELSGWLIETARAEEAARPHVYIFGGGHVGRALASSFALLPVRAVVVETRAQELLALANGVEARLTAVPEEAVRDAPDGSAFLILTHDHALDFLILAEALKRADAAYVGMVGSKTKKATFRSWYIKNAGGTEEALARLVCPIGGAEVKDKRPPVIAALTAAEVMTALARQREYAEAE